MTQSESLKIDKNLITPIALLFSALALIRLVNVIQTLYFSSGDFNISHIIPAVLWLALAVVLWIFAGIRNRKLFFLTATAASLALFLLNALTSFIVDSTTEINFGFRIIWLLADFTVIFLVFSLFSYRKHLTADEDTGIDVLSFIGTLFIVGGVVEAGSTYILNSEYFHWAFLLRPVVQIIVGIGFLVRDRFFGFIGNIIYFAMVVYGGFSYIQYDKVRAVFNLIQGSLFPLAVIVICILLWKTAFKRNLAASFFDSLPSSSGGGGYTYTSAIKTCSRCGRSVPLSSHAGQSCPHCGAYWSTETTRRN
ncbi:hypothetical protein JW935_00385 [candidate division KSB1 bacterium]|nr:hypothetical protein [candidate division KSB1 bacterium]